MIFNLSQPYVAADAIVQILGDSPERYQIVMNDREALEISNVAFQKLKLTKAMKDIILERSFHNQIENAYFSIKPDSIGSPNIALPFYRNRAGVYNLDDYTRFSSVKETFVGIINNVWLGKDGEGSPVFRVRGNPPYSESPFPALLLVDGVLIRGHQKLLDYNSRKIKRIYVGRERYIIGGEIFHGVVDIQTLDGDYDVALEDNSLYKIELIPALPKKKYFQQRYGLDNNVTSDRIPDFRRQLLWQPDVKLHWEEKELSFFTSDVTGNFEILLQGFTASGQAISVRETFKVH